MRVITVQVRAAVWAAIRMRVRDAGELKVAGLATDNQ